MTAGPRVKPLAAVIALATSLLVALISIAIASDEESDAKARSEASLSAVMDFLSNTAPDKVEAAAERLVAPDATYVSLNFENPELQRILPWTGTNYGPKAFSSLFLQVASYWEIEDFTVTDSFASGQDVAIFGKFTYRSVTLGHGFTSPFSIHARVRDGKMTYFQFMEDTYASTSSFRQSGVWTVKTTEDTAPFTVGVEQP